MSEDGKTYFLDQALDYKHISETLDHDENSMPMQGEVGLLSRNIVFRGDPDNSIVNEYGAHIMIHSINYNDKVEARIEYIEL